VIPAGALGWSNEALCLAGRPGGGNLAAAWALRRSVRKAMVNFLDLGDVEPDAAPA
jgi:hypothetical protein